MSGKIHNKVSARQLALQPGAPVTVTRDDGSKFTTRAAGAPWFMVGHTWCIPIESIVGSYALCRVQPAIGGGT